MATRTFPIFRSVQRSIVGSAGAGKHEPTLAVTARHLLGNDEGINNAEVEERSDEPRLPDEHNLDARDDGKDGIIIGNPNTWPINSERARQLRREFVQEGYRRLYHAASGQMPLMGSTGYVIGSGESDNNAALGRASLLGAAGDGTIDTDEEPNNAINEDERPPAISINGDEDWLYYAQ